VDRLPGRTEDRWQLPPGAARGRDKDDRRQGFAVTAPAPATAPADVSPPSAAPPAGVVTQRAVSGIWINLWPGSTAKLPPLVLPDSESFEATVLREELVTALDTAGCHHEVNPVLTFGEQSSILTQSAEVCAVFSLPGRDHHVPHHDRHYLDVMHKHTA